MLKFEKFEYFKISNLKIDLNSSSNQLYQLIIQKIIIKDMFQVQNLMLNLNQFKDLIYRERI